MSLSGDAIRRIDREVAKYPADRKQSAVMAALDEPAARLRRQIMRALSWDIIIRQQLEPLLNRA